MKAVDVDVDVDVDVSELKRKLLSDFLQMDEIKQEEILESIKANSKK